MTNDVEKQWKDPPTFRAALSYVVTIVALAGVAFIAFLTIARDSPMWAMGTPLVLLAGAVGAFIQTYRVWRARGTWPIWHGAGWFLLTLMLVSLSIPAMAITEL